MPGNLTIRTFDARGPLSETLADLDMMHGEAAALAMPGFQEPGSPLPDRPLLDRTGLVRRFTCLAQRVK